MRLTFLAAILATMVMTACGRPNQALPEQERENFERITSQSGGSAAPASGTDADGSDTSPDAGTSPTPDATDE